LVACTLQVLSVETHLAGQLFPGNRKPVENQFFQKYTQDPVLILAIGSTSIYFLNSKKLFSLFNDNALDVESPFHPTNVGKTFLVSFILTRFQLIQGGIDQLHGVRRLQVKQRLRREIFNF
jgi:hypothetical protein